MGHGTHAKGREEKGLASSVRGEGRRWPRGSMSHSPHEGGPRGGGGYSVVSLGFPCGAEVGPVSRTALWCLFACLLAHLLPYLPTYLPTRGALVPVLLLLAASHGCRCWRCCCCSEDGWHGWDVGG